MNCLNLSEYTQTNLTSKYNIRSGNVPNGEASHEGNEGAAQGIRGGGQRRFSRNKRPRNSQSDKTGGEKVNNFDN